MAALCGGVCGRRGRFQEEWFRAASVGDSRTILKLLSKHSNAPSDIRPTLAHGTIFNGFAAIHYAAYNGHEELVKILLKTEASALTQKPIRISAIGILNSRLHIQLDAGATALMVAIIRGHINIALTILEYALGHEISCIKMKNTAPISTTKSKPKAPHSLPPKVEARNNIIGAQTHTKVSALILLVSLNSSEAVTLLRANNYLLLREEAELVTREGGNIALMIALLGRDKILEAIISFILGPDEYYTDMNSRATSTTVQLLIRGPRVVGPLPPFQREKSLFLFAIKFMKMSMKRDSRGFSVLDSARYKLDEKKYGISRTAKERTYLLFNNLLWRVHIFTNNCAPINVQNPCEHWDNYDTCCSRLGVASDDEFRELAGGLAHNIEINQIVEDMLATRKLHKLMRPYSSSVTEMQTKNTVLEAESLEPGPSEDLTCHSEKNTTSLEIRANVFNSSIEPSSTLNSTLMLTKTIVNGQPEDLTEPSFHRPISTAIQGSIDLAQLTPLTKSSLSARISARVSGSLRLDLDLDSNFDDSSALSPQVLI